LFEECGHLNPSKSSLGRLSTHLGETWDNAGFCPSCGARRMAESAALLVDDVLPHEPMSP
jgi:hypothetical protein